MRKGESDRKIASKEAGDFPPERSKSGNDSAPHTLQAQRNALSVSDGHREREAGNVVAMESSDAIRISSDEEAVKATEFDDIKVSSSHELMEIAEGGRRDEEIEIRIQEALLESHKWQDMNKRDINTEETEMDKPLFQDENNAIIESKLEENPSSVKKEGDNEDEGNELVYL